MTTNSATRSRIEEWAATAARRIEETQTLAELPEDQRTFPPLQAQEVADLAQCSVWTWREYARNLPPGKQLNQTAGGHYRPTLAEVHEFMELTGARPRRPDYTKRAMRIAVENFKGGSTKSTTCLHLGIAFARMGYRVLLVDADPQATLTQMLGVRPSKVNVRETFASALTRTADGAYSPLMPRSTYISGLSLIPANLRLSSLEIDVMRMLSDQSASASDIEMIFDRALSSVDADFDLVLVDFQPAFSMTQALMLMTMDSLLIPMPTEASDFAGTRDFLQQISDVLKPLEALRGAPKKWDPALVVHTRMRKGTDLVHELIASTFGSHRMLQYVDDQPAISAAMATMRSVFEVNHRTYDRRAIRRAQDQYQVLAKAIIEAIEARWTEMAEEVNDD